MKKLLTLLIVLVIVGCAHGKIVVNGTPTTPPEKDREVWTVLLYLDYEVAALRYTVYSMQEADEAELKKLEDAAKEKKECLQNFLEGATNDG